MSWIQWDFLSVYIRLFAQSGHQTDTRLHTSCNWRTVVNPSILAPLGIFAVLEMGSGNVELPHGRQFSSHISARLLPNHTHARLLSWNFKPHLQISTFWQKKCCLLLWADQNLLRSSECVSKQTVKQSKYNTQLISLNQTETAFRVQC